MQQKLEVTEEEDCIPVIMAALKGQRVIRVDGHSGMGKSRIAKAIAKLPGWIRIAGDDHLDHPRNGRLYHDQVTAPSFKKAATEALDRGMNVVLDALCLDYIVEPLCFGPEFRVYMSSITDAESHEDERRRNLNLGSTQYHLDIRPDEKADLFVWKRAKF